MNLLSISDLNPEEIESIFSDSCIIEQEETKLPLKGKTILLFFPESSIRTRITFEMAVKQLGGELILFPPSSLDKRESLKDVASYVENWVDGIIVRHSDIAMIRSLARPGAMLIPCPPFYRGEEVSEGVIDSMYFVGYGFKRNLLAVQKAIILFCLRQTV